MSQDEDDMYKSKARGGRRLEGQLQASMAMANIF